MAGRWQGADDAEAGGEPARAPRHGPCPPKCELQREAGVSRIRDPGKGPAQHRANAVTATAALQSGSLEEAVMKLTPAHLEQFDRDGYLFFEELFSKKEIQVLVDAVPSLYAQRRPENVREKTGDVVRTNFAAHLYSYPFAKLARHPRMLEPVKQVFGEDVYMHQFKINGKMAFDGDVWQWHQ